MSSLLDVLHKRQPRRTLEPLVETDSTLDEAGCHPPQVAPALELTLAAETRTVTTVALDSDEASPSPADSPAAERVAEPVPARRHGDPYRQ